MFPWVSAENILPRLLSYSLGSAFSHWLRLLPHPSFTSPYWLCSCPLSLPPCSQCYLTSLLCFDNNCASSVPPVVLNNFSASLQSVVTEVVGNERKEINIEVSWLCLCSLSCKMRFVICHKACRRINLGVAVFPFSSSYFFLSFLHFCSSHVSHCFLTIMHYGVSSKLLCKTFSLWKIKLICCWQAKCQGGEEEVDKYRW